MSQKRSDQSRGAASVVFLASVLALAGCNPAPNADKAPASVAPASAAPVSTTALAPPAPLQAPAVPDATATAIPASAAAATSGTAPKPATQTTPATAAKPTAGGTASPPARTPVVTAGLPAGAGREVVQRVCGSCHGIDTVTAVGRTPQQWTEIIGQMQNMGLSASDEDLATIHAYLSRQLPPK